MAMIEVVLGLILLAAGCAIALGLADSFVPLPIGLPAAYLALILGTALVIHGLFRILINREGIDRHWFRTRGLAATTIFLLAILGFGVPAAAPFLNAFGISGFPLGYYMASQGTLIALVMLLFAFASRADAIDADETPAAVKGTPADVGE